MKLKSLIVYFIIMAGIIMLYAGMASGEPVGIRIKSVYFDPVNHKWSEPVIWIFSRSNENLIEVSGGIDKDIIVKLSYDNNNRLIKVERKNQNEKSKYDIFDYSKSSIVLSDGFPVPYDYLGSYDDLSPEAVMKKRAGGVKFSIRFARNIRNVDIDFAQKENMVNSDMAKRFEDSGLKLITIKRDGKIVAKQLWPENFSWWIYEETPFRKSWLIP